MDSIHCLGSIAFALDSAPCLDGDIQVIQIEAYEVRPEMLDVHATCFCTQHKTGSAVEHITRRLELLSPSFCVASFFSHGDKVSELERHIKDVLADNLSVVDPSDVDDLRRDSADFRRLTAFGKLLLDECFVHDGADEAEEDDDGAIKTAREKRRKQAADLLAFFPTPFTGRLVHPCPDGCCGVGPKANRAASVDRGLAVLRPFLTPAVGTPALNKYTKVDPTVRRTVLMSYLFGIMREAMLRLNGKKASDDGQAVSDQAVSDQALTEDALVGAPTDEQAHHRLVEQTRLDKCCLYFEQKYNKTKGLLWLAICSPIMRIHYRLFAKGTFYGHKDQRASVFDFCEGAARNPVTPCLDALAALHFEPESAAGREGLQLLQLRFGPTQAWPLHLVDTLQICLLKSFCELWRKLYSIAPRIPPGWVRESLRRGLRSPSKVFVLFLLLLWRCWLVGCSAFAWLRRFAVVLFRIVWDVCCRLAPKASGNSRRAPPRFLKISGRFSKRFLRHF